MNPPKLEHYVNDASKVLSESVRHEVNERLKNHDTQTTVQAVVYLFPHRQGRELLDIGLEIFDENGIGQKDTNNGLLLIVATEEKKLRIITGKGMEFEWNTEKCQLIVEQILRPLLNAEKYDEMVKAWCDCVEGKNNNLLSRKDDSIYLLIFGSVLLFILGGVIGFITYDPLVYSEKIDQGMIIFYMIIAFIFLGLFRLILTRNLYFRCILILFIFGIIITPGIVIKEYIVFSNQCVQVKTCFSTDTKMERWEKFQAINLEVAETQAEIDRRWLVEDKRLHPEKYQYSSSDSDSSSSSSDSDFGGGGGSSNGGGYGD